MCQPTTSAWTSKVVKSRTSRARRTSAGNAPEKGGPGGYKGEFIAWDAIKGEKDLGHQRTVSPSGAARSRPRATSSSMERSMAGSRPLMRAMAQFSISSRWTGVVGNPMTYTGPDGKQYVAGLGGYRRRYGFADRGRRRRRICRTTCVSAERRCRTWRSTRRGGRNVVRLFALSLGHSHAHTVI